ncbi:MAG: NADPH:quinone oxidoreductase family protein [Amylibacter sp.]
MRAMMSVEVGGPDALVMTEVATPAPKKGEVVIRVRAAGVNFPDTLIIRDLYQMKPERPFAPGGEVAGDIEAVGEGVTHLSVGQRVLAVPGFNGFATHVVAHKSGVIPIPDAMPYDQASCFLLTYGTSHYALKQRGQLQKGETLLILGAAGGVGAAAIELGKAMGAKVIAAVSSEEKAAFCKKLGADETIIYPREMDRDAQKAFSGAIKDVAGAGGVNVVYDAVGGNYAEPAVRALAWEGRFLVIGFPAGIPKLPLNLTLLKNCQVVGVFWGAFTRMEPEVHKANMAELFDWWGKGLIKPQISASFTLENAGDALKMLEDRKVLGKVVIEVG